ncbi:AraC family transcriptional regulator [Paenibacillus sp. GCM10027626]|uniref:AraC family transcriptional regulator n=1 Tax=Paenibacillus sp. GCM10027626 TaxID=3273411 RepID=UPI0036286D2B
MFYSLSRLVQLDVKWADLFDANSSSFKSAHSNPYYQLIAVAEGPVRIEAGGERLTLKTGQTLLLQPWEQHSGWHHHELQGSFFWAQFSCEPSIAPFQIDPGQAPDIQQLHAEKTELRTSAPNHEDLIVIPRLFQSNNRYRILGLFEQLIQTARAAKGYYRFQETLLLSEIFRLIASDFLEQHHSDTALPLSYFTYRNLVNFLNNFYQQEIGKERLESALDRKYEHLCHIFKRYSGTTIVNYITQLRIQRAKHLLLYTDATVAEIAADVGYNDPFYFSRMFKRLEGSAPQNYRTAAVQLPPST